MPWSEWITPPPTTVSGSAAAVPLHRYAEAEFDTLIDVNAEVEKLLGTLRSGGGLDQQAASDQFIYGDQRGPADTPRNKIAVALSQTIYAVEVRSDVATRRDWFPTMLDSLEYGVDYDVRPDRTGSENDAYVEYETDEPNTLIGWQPWAMRFEHHINAEAAGNAYPPEPATIPVRVGLAAGPLEDFSWQPYGFGDELLTLSEFPGSPEVGWSNAGAQEPTVPIPVPAEVLQFGLAAQPATLAGAAPTLTVFDPPVLSGEASASILKQTVALASAPTYVYQMPRWRYWIPGDTVQHPLRQKQRNDGLARGVYRARSTSSIQNSVRQNSYR